MRLLWVILAIVAALSAPARAQERELDQDTAATSVDEIETPIQRVFPVEEEERTPLFPWLSRRLNDLPPFLRDTQLEVRYRTYYLRQDQTFGTLSEAWAMGGSLYYRSGWLEDFFATELEGFTSQPIIAKDSRAGTLLLKPIQDGFGVLGIANGKLRYKGLVLTGFRQYLDLPYVNPQDNRMVANTFEAITLTRPEGRLRFSTGYSWNVKLRDSDDFESFTEAIGLDEDRGYAHAGATWDPSEDLHLGVVGGIVPDLFAGLYAEASFAHSFTDDFQARLDAQFTYRWDPGKDLGEDLIDETWNLGFRASTSYRGSVIRLGASFTGSEGGLESLFGSTPSYVDLMQRTFNRPDEKALLASVSYDFSRIGLTGLSGVVNFVAAFDGEVLGKKRDSQAVDITLDYRGTKGWFKTLWLRVRFSYLNEEGLDGEGTDVRLIFRYDIPVL